MFKNTLSSRVRAWHLPATLLATILLVAACGGGGGGGGSTPSATPQTFSTGTITGFGSIVVNGVHYDESTATVMDDDDGSVSSSSLELGMVVEIQGGEIVRGASKSSCKADEVVVRSAIKGPVEAVDATAGTLTVLGQSVVVSAATIFDGITGGLSGLSVGNEVAVYALPGAQPGVYNATRIELKAGLESYKLRGAVASLDTTAKTFRIGNALIDYSQIAPDRLPVLADGLLVRAKLNTVKTSAGAWVATRIKAVERRIEDRAEAEAEGYVTGFVSLSSFKVDGITVDASGPNVRFEGGVPGDVADGAKLEVEGQVVSGVLVARKVEFKNDEQEAAEFELEGPIQAVTQGSPVGTGTLTVRDTAVSFGAFTTFQGGTASDLAVGRKVDVKAELQSGGTTLRAIKISFENN